jgi:hypothetical protein
MICVHMFFAEEAAAPTSMPAEQPQVPPRTQRPTPPAAPTAEPAASAPAPQGTTATPSRHSTFDDDLRSAMQMSLMDSVSAPAPGQTPLRRFDPNVCPPDVDPDVFFSLPPEDREEILIAMLQSEQSAPAPVPAAALPPTAPAPTASSAPALIPDDAMAMMFQVGWGNRVFLKGLGWVF